MSVKKYPKAELYIEAMKKTLKEYQNGTHEFDMEECALCKVTKAKARRVSECKNCPWIQIEGECCVIRRDSIRIKELKEWIKIYEDSLNIDKDDIIQNIKNGLKYSFSTNSREYRLFLKMVKSYEEEYKKDEKIAKYRDIFSKISNMIYEF